MSKMSNWHLHLRVFMVSAVWVLGCVLPLTVPVVLDITLSVKNRSTSHRQSPPLELLTIFTLTSLTDASRTEAMLFQGACYDD